MPILAALTCGPPAVVRAQERAELRGEVVRLEMELRSEQERLVGSDGKGGARWMGSAGRSWVRGDG
jgi:hypothetical protein